MKKTLVLIILLFCSIIVTQAQQKIEINENFSQLTLAGNLHVTIRQVPDSTCKIDVTIYGNNNSQLFKWNLKNDMMSLSLPTGILDKSSYAVVDIACPNLRNLVCQGVSVVSKGTLKSDLLTIEATNSVNIIELNLEIGQLEVKAGGNSNIKLKGDVQWAIINASLGAKVDAIHASINDCSAKVGQNAEVLVNVEGRLDANATTKGTVFYKGEPSLVVKTSLGGGVVPIITPSI